ncbi:MAG TPA: hypothetical protein VIC55_12265 [Gemmatimonadaceae bacterium]
MHQDKYVPADNNSGWGVASFILLLTAAFIVAATVIHKRTYKHPWDVTAQIHGAPHIEGVK